MKKVLYCLVVFSVIVSFVTSPTAAEAQAVFLTRDPYIQNLTTTSVVIAWRTNMRADSLIRYDYTPWADSAQYRFTVSSDTSTTEHALTLGGLFPDITYYYWVESGGIILASGESFHTARTTSNPQLTFAVISDTHSGRESTAELAERISEANADLLLVVGDLVFDHGGPGELDAFFDYFKELVRRIPAFPALGNHDSYQDNAEWYQRDFYLPANNPEGSELYYSFDYGNAHFISLTVIEPETLDWKEGSAQYNWLVNDLENTNQFWKFVYFHFPPYDSGGRYERFLDVKDTLSPVLEKYGVDIVFSGHEHTYERTIPMRDYYEGSKGVTYIVCGSFGGYLGESGPNQWTAYVEPGQPAATIVDIDGPSLDLRTVRTDGSLMDSMTIDRSQELLASMEVEPTTLAEEAEYEWLTVYIEPSAGYDPINMDISSIKLNNELVPITAPRYSFVTNPDEYLVDRDGDGLKERVLKFDYEQVWQILNTDEGNVPLRLTGSNNGSGFEAGSSVYVIPQEASYKITIGDINPSGGEIKTLDGQILVDFPQGAVTGDARVIIRQEPLEEAPSLPLGLEAGAATRFSLVATGNLPSGAMVTIKVRYTGADTTAGVKPQLLTLLRYDEDSGEWTVIPSIVDTAAMTVTVATDHIDGEWMLAAETGRIFGLPIWGWITIGVTLILLTILFTRRYA